MSKLMIFIAHRWAVNYSILVIINHYLGAIVVEVGKTLSP